MTVIYRVFLWALFSKHILIIGNPANKLLFEVLFMND